MEGGGTPRLRKHSDGTAGSSALLYVSLYLVLLVFFVLLNAISEREQRRVAGVMSSVERRFAVDQGFTLDPRLRHGQDPVTARSLAPRAQVAVSGLESLGNLFVADIAVARVTHLTPGRLMEIRLPVEDVFVRDGIAIRSDRAELFDHVADSLRQRPPGVHFDLEMLLGFVPPVTPATPVTPTTSGPNATPVAENAGGRGLAVARTTALAYALLRHGAPVDSVSVGLEPGDSTALRLMFFARPVEEADERSGDGQ